jgi:hypothetical protein
VLIGFGGEKNWEIHTSSAAHQRALREAAALPKKNLLSFFGKPSSSPTPVNTSDVVAVAPLLVASTTPTALVAPPPTPSAPSVENPAISTPATAPDIPILQELFHTIQTLPETVPIGVPSDVLAAFFSSPKDLVQDGEDAWEDVVNPMLDRMLGFGATADAIRALIRRGKYGMDGLYRFIKSCICDLNIHTGLLEGKIERLVEAMVEL